MFMFLFIKIFVLHFTFIIYLGIAIACELVCNQVAIPIAKIYFYTYDSVKTSRWFR